MLEKNAINTIRGIISRNEYRNLPVYVFFSGRKNSLVVLDLARTSLKQRELKAFFLNTGIEFPKTVEFVRNCEICVKACPVGTASLDGKTPHVSEACIRCGKCTESCVITRYFDKLVPDLNQRSKV
ncbi:phosphoadenosine phosphosulfate reductase family protein [Methanosarcina sp. UBA289]|uniref:phosphoadenosine phosphosulfate reductase domain-containing protein n=1 Tax=Methanosarcina sp. UBA289 TaxID=1915574 RepID=UPI0025EE4A6E|nr:phosphoadenosine phosphosulfate reductase family protein [Methanosarcina sp. UBA289]